MAGPGAPRWWNCQVCRHPLDVVGADFAADRSTAEPPRGGHGAHSSVIGTGSVFSGSRMDSSFVVLPKQRSPAAVPLPPRSRPGTHGASQGFPDGRPLHPGQSQASNVGPPHLGSGPGIAPPGVAGAPYPGQNQEGSGGPPQPGTGPHGYAGAPWEGGVPGRGMEESFVVLPSSAASMYGPGDGGGAGVAAGHGSLDSRIMGLTRVFELAAQQTLVEHPLCTECSRALQEELSLEVRGAEEDIAAYEACLQRFEADQHRALSEEEFTRELQQAEEEERRVEAELAAVEEERAQVRVQLREVERKAAEVDELQQRYWHDWNDFKLQLHAHQEERDAVLAGIEVASAQLEALKKTNVLNDAFHIWFEGDFGTINGFRLGRLPNTPVEWDEINAAWGQACLLLFTMAQTCRFTFTFRILPMGSYPRIADAKTSYDLFGPVNLFWSTRYDKAMVLFLACLKEFGEFAHAKDRAAGLPPDKCFQLPYKIDNDKVNDYTIKQSFNRDERWTKALKYTLCNLKWVAAWLINTATTPVQSLRNTAPVSAGHVAAPGGGSSPVDKQSNLAASEGSISAQATHKA